jgi:hypothetical protein
MLSMKPSCGNYLQKVFGLTLEFRSRTVSKRSLFDTLPSFLLCLEQQGYRLVLKPVSKSKFQNLAYATSFDTNETP